MSGDGVRPVHPPPPKKRGGDSAATRWTGPAFSGRLPGVVESGLMDSERVSSSERTMWTSSRNNCEGRSSWLKPERIDYSQTILDNLISIKGFRTGHILQEDVQQITNEYTNSKRFLSGLKHVCSISCLWINWFKQRNTKSTNHKKKVMYNRDWKKVERYIENRVLGFSVHCAHWSTRVVPTHPLPSQNLSSSLFSWS